MRGTPFPFMGYDANQGIIPAYAGNTEPDAKKSLHDRDHPRVCGEHSVRIDRNNSARGSSPRMRGTLGAFARPKQHGGIIPAYAGNTLRDYSNFVVSKFMSFVFHLV